MLDGFDTQQVDVGGVEINFKVRGDGPPLLLLHGYPQTHVMWHRVAPTLAERFTVVASDLRGYGDSAKPSGGDQHIAYSKRVLAADQVVLMQALGFDRFAVVGHDRGARVTHRMCLDHPDRIGRAAVLDILPTTEAFAQTDMTMAKAYFHWFFLIQPYDLPERLIGADPEFFFDRLIRVAPDDPRFDPDALAEYRRCFCNPATIHASCEEYRAAATIDLEHDAESRDQKVECPLLVLWGRDGFVGLNSDPMAVWRRYAINIQGKAIPGGHYLAEEAPEDLLKELLPFLLD